jgi:Protein of unknown function (DUF3443)
MSRPTTNGLRIFLLFPGFSALVFCVACGGSSTTPATTTTAPTPTSTTPSGNNVASISVNGGPLGNYADGAFVNVTVCVPGTSTCETVDDVLVDTGSSGLRILSSVLTIALPQQTSSSSEPVVECLPFVSSYAWGPVQTADVEVAVEKASSVPIQVLSDTDYTAPTSCTDQGSSSDTLDSLGANGILGVGLFVQDCGSYCETVQTAPGNVNLYYECSSSTSCQPIGEALSAQVANPVSLFTTDNNGVIIELPSISGGQEASATGSLVFGIGTESNNALGSATIYTANDEGNFTTTFNGVTYSGESFIDSGSNGLFFPDTSITQCPSSEAPGFYCPSTTENFSATNLGENESSGTVDFSIANAVTLFDSNDNAFSDLGGTFDGEFDWGFPFFFGQNVYVGLQSSTYVDGYWAY